MSSVEELKNIVVRRAEEEAKRIIEGAEKEAERIVREAEEKRMKLVEEAKKKVISDIGYEQRLAEAKANARKVIAEAKSSVLNDLRKNILRLLNDLDDARRFASLRNLIMEALQAIEISRGKRIILRVSNKDLRFAEMLSRDVATKHSISVSVEPIEISGGVIIEDVDTGIIVDNSYEARLRRILTINAPKIQERLFSS